MAYIKIPTGMQTVTATVSRKSFMKYQCCKCGKAVLHEYVLSQQASDSYHVFQSKETKNNVKTGASAQAAQLLDRQDAALFNAINFEHNYELVSQPVKCPHCGQRQPWSNVPVDWRKTDLSIWIIGLVLSLFASVFMLYFIPVVGAVFAVATVLLVLWPVFHSVKRKKALHLIQTSTFLPPVYYNKQNIQQLLNSLQSKQNQVSNSSKELKCPNCGSQLNASNRFCGRCGFRYN